MTVRKQWLSYFTERGSHMKMAKSVDHLNTYVYGRLFFSPLMYKLRLAGGKMETGHKKQRMRKQLQLEVRNRSQITGGTKTGSSAQRVE